MYIWAWREKKIFEASWKFKSNFCFPLGPDSMTPKLIFCHWNWLAQWVLLVLSLTTLVIWVLPLWSMDRFAIYPKTLVGNPARPFRYSRYDIVMYNLQALTWPFLLNTHLDFEIQISPSQVKNHCVVHLIRVHLSLIHLILCITHKLFIHRAHFLFLMTWAMFTLRVCQHIPKALKISKAQARWNRAEAQSWKFLELTNSYQQDTVTQKRQWPKPSWQSLDTKGN